MTSSVLFALKSWMSVWDRDWSFVLEIPTKALSVQPIPTQGKLSQFSSVPKYSGAQAGVDGTEVEVKELHGA